MCLLAYQYQSTTRPFSFTLVTSISTPGDMELEHFFNENFNLKNLTHCAIASKICHERYGNLPPIPVIIWCYWCIYGIIESRRVNWGNVGRFLDHNIRHVIARDYPNPTGAFHTSMASVDSLVSKYIPSIINALVVSQSESRKLYDVILGQSQTERGNFGLTWVMSDIAWGKKKKKERKTGLHSWHHMPTSKPKTPPPKTCLTLPEKNSFSFLNTMEKTKKSANSWEIIGRSWAPGTPQVPFTTADWSVARAAIHVYETYWYDPVYHWTPALAK